MSPVLRIQRLRYFVTQACQEMNPVSVRLVQCWTSDTSVSSVWHHRQRACLSGMGSVLGGVVDALEVNHSYLGCRSSLSTDARCLCCWHQVFLIKDTLWGIVLILVVPDFQIPPFSLPRKGLWATPVPNELFSRRRTFNLSMHNNEIWYKTGPCQ